MFQRIHNSWVQPCVFNVMQHPQVFYPVIGVYSVDVIDLIGLFQRLDKCVGDKAMH